MEIVENNAAAAAELGVVAAKALLKACKAGQCSEGDTEDAKKLLMDRPQISEAATK